MFSKKGQVSIEILIVLSILIVAGVLFGVYYINNLNKTTQDLGGKEVTDVTNTFKDSLSGFTVEIISPRNNETYDVGETINFRVGFGDQNGTPTCVWEGISLNYCNDSNSFSDPGTKLITVTAMDGDINATDSVKIIIEPS